MFAAVNRQAGRLRGWIGALVVVLGLAVPAAAQETFLGVPVTPDPGTYRVIDNVNVRTRPSTSSRRIKVLRKGEKVEAVGRSKDGNWLAVRKQGEDLGFVYAPLLELIIEKKIKPDFSIPMTPVTGTYLVVKEINVRAKPKTSSRKIGSLDKGQRVEAVGRPKEASWLAVRKQDEDLGFVYAPALLALIDGALDADIKGRVSVSGGASCGYTIRYEGRAEVEGEPFGTFDYDLLLQCIHKGTLYEFLAPMFITEVPYDLSQKPIYQISIDVLEVGDNYDETFSTVFMYHRKDRRVVFDGVSLKEFRAPPKVAEKPAEGVATALAAATEIAIAAWNDKFWEALAASRE